MTNRCSKYFDPDDVFADSRMTFGDHLEELRTHLLRALKGFVLGLMAGFILSPFVLNIMTDPVKKELDAFQKRRVDKVREQLAADPKLKEMGFAVESRKVNLKELARALGLPPPHEEWGLIPFATNRYEDALNQEIARLDLFPPSLKSFSLTESILVYFQVALLAGCILASPWIFFQIWSFIAAGLYRHEKRLINLFLPFSLALFLGGCLLCQFVVMPKAVASLLWFNELLGIEPDLRLSEWLGFALMLPLVFGLSFQTPVVVFFVHRIGMVDVAVFRRNRRLAWFLLACFAALLTPTPDPVNMFLLWIPLGLLYELGIWLCRWAPRTQSLGWEEEKEMVEV